LTLSITFWNCISTVLQALPEFPTKGRWEWMWFPRRDRTRIERRRLPGGGVLVCRIADYYEAWVWMRLYDREELCVLRSLLHSGETFVDAGAHIGVWSLEAGAAVGKTGRVLSLEPNPATFAKLEHNLSLNPGLAQWEPKEVATSSKEGTALLNIEELSECCSIVDSGANGVSVKTASIDQLLAGSICHGLKVDVEGHELFALEGARSTLEKYHPWICVEFNNLIHKLPSLGAWPVHQLLTQLGYRCWHFRDAADRHQHPNVSPDFTTTGYVNLFYCLE
jgi:FkbM family methyltransferase